MTERRSNDRPHSNFILLGHARCGSNLLLRALAEHPQIRAAGELLAPEEAVRAVAWTGVNPKAWPAERGEGYRAGDDAGEFLREKVFSDGVVENTSVFGFKLFYDTKTADAGLRAGWDYVVANDVRVIHLERANLLYTLISKKVAEQTNEWYRMVEQGADTAGPLPPFELDPAECATYFDAIVAQRRMANEEFASHPMVHLEYERDLCGNFHETTQLVFDFLGAIPWFSRPKMMKQQSLTASQQVKNFAELRAYFAKTQYADFFADADSAEGVRAATV